MSKKERHVKLSRYLSYILRHAPEKGNILLDDQGWTSVDVLIKNNPKFTLAILEEIVNTDNKQRYSFSENKKMIRANQGHSVSIDLSFEKAYPPAKLYHGTAEKFIEAIRKKGLMKMKRHHVHMTANVDTAKSVGKRYGQLVLLEIDCLSMRRDGFEFFRSENNVWLVSNVPYKYIKEIAV